MEKGGYVNRFDLRNALCDAGEVSLRGVIIINDFPAADVVEVVRCRDCEWWGHAGCAIRIVDDADKPRENDFCSFGERKEETK